MELTIPEKLAVTGRVQSWLDNPNKRLPVSCTVFVVEDSMEGPEGIEASWLFTSKALRNAAGVAIHLSKLRPKGTANADGLVASGPVSFAKIYSILNEILRRGGLFKNGAITLHLDYNHPDALEFIQARRYELPWVKRALNVDEGFLNWEHLEDALEACRSGDLWLVKKRFDKNGERIYHNVCLEVLLESRGTCLLSHVNLGACKVSEIPTAMVEGMSFLCQLHSQTGVGESGIYLPPSEDKQVGLGVLGLANLLAIEGVSYADFAEALESYMDFVEGKPDSHFDYNGKAHAIAESLFKGYGAATRVAKRHAMERAFVIAPTATCSYQNKDREGYTTTPEIAAPIDRQIDRDSDTFGVQSYDYNPKVEIAAEVGWETHFKLNCAWQRLMNHTGLAHAISMNWWSDMTAMDSTFISKWLDSPLLSLYYSLQVMPSTQDKSTVYLDGDFTILGLGQSSDTNTDAATPNFCSACSE